MAIGGLGKDVPTEAGQAILRALSEAPEASLELFQQLATAPAVWRWAGSCSCGGCAYVAATARRKAALRHCHCGMCRRAGGATMQTWTPVERKDLVWQRRDPLTRVQTSREACRESCSSCGSSLTLVHLSDQETVWMAAATADTMPNASEEDCTV